MNRFIRANGRAAYSARRFVKEPFDISAFVIAVENKPGDGLPSKTFLLLQIYLGLRRNACLFTCIQVRIFPLTVYGVYISHLARVIWL
jgi:hypothetical protein